MEGEEGVEGRREWKGEEEWKGGGSGKGGQWKGRGGGVEGEELSTLPYAVVNTGIGASLFEDNFSKVPGEHVILWPLLAVVTFIATLLLVLVIVVKTDKTGTGPHPAV